MNKGQKRGLLLHIHSPRIALHNLRFSATLGLGVMLTTCFFILVITGVLLMLVYEPEFSKAYNSVWEITYVLSFGNFLRTVHYYSGTLFLILGVAHFLRILYVGAYAGQRYRNYLCGLVLLAAIFGALLTGYLLPMDEVAYWALKVGLTFLNYLPLGQTFQEMVLGGFEINTPMIVRIYVLHIVFMPLVMIGAISYHFWRIRKDRGLLLPKTLSDKEVATVSATPHATTRELTLGLVLTLMIVAVGYWLPMELAHSAIPSSPPNPVKATWLLVATQETLSYSIFWGGIFPIFAIVLFFILAPRLAGNQNGYPVLWRQKTIFYITIMLLFAYIVFTIIALYFRGPNWQLLPFNDVIQIFNLP